VKKYLISWKSTLSYFRILSDPDPVGNPFTRWIRELTWNSQMTLAAFGGQLEMASEEQLSAIHWRIGNLFRGG